MRFEQFLLNEGINDKGIFKSYFMAGTPGSGKAQPLDSLVLTDKGWIRMGDINIGDKVITPDNSTSTVTHLHPQGEVDIYKVTLYDGRTVECCGDHLWKIHGFLSRKNSTNIGSDGRLVSKRDWSIRTTNELFEKQDVKMYKNRLHLPKVEPIDFLDNVDLPLNPYTLGVLLGDGCLKNNTVSFTTVDHEIQNRVSNLLPEGNYITHNENNISYFIRGTNEDNKNRINEIIREMGLMETYSYEKFIPEEYKNSSIENRLELARGLMDTDGESTKSGQIIFYTTSEKLANDFCYIVWSLGDNAIKREKVPYYKNPNGDKIRGRKCYCITILSHNPEKYFHLKRKKDRASINLQKRNINHNLKIRIDKIEYIGKKEAQCITIDSKEHLYITNNFIVTHNSFVAKKLSGGVEPRFVNTDTWTEFFKAYSDELWKEFKEKIQHLTQAQLIQYLNGMLPLWIDGTSARTGPTLRRKGILGSMGYDTGMIWVETSIESALDRASKRERPVDPKFIKLAYDNIQQLKPFYQKQFDPFITVKNDEGELNEKVISKLYSKTGSFWTKPIDNPIGRENYENLLETGGKYITDLKRYDMQYLKKMTTVWYGR